jgi:hypothetical protein
MRRFIAVVFAGLIACGGGAAAPATDSGIDGVVLIGPTCPVEQVGQDCEDKPYAGSIKIIDASSGEVVATAHSDADGKFRVALAPGSYRLEPAAASGGLPYGKPIDVVVRPHTYEVVTVSFDSGIR